MRKVRAPLRTYAVALVAPVSLLAVLALLSAIDLGYRPGSALHEMANVSPKYASSS